MVRFTLRGTGVWLYDRAMIELTPEQSAQLLASPGGLRCRVVGTETQYVLVEAGQPRTAEPADRGAVDDIKAGLRDLEAGRTYTVDEAEARIDEHWRSGPAR